MLGDQQAGTRRHRAMVPPPERPMCASLPRVGGQADGRHEMRRARNAGRQAERHGRGQASGPAARADDGAVAPWTCGAGRTPCPVPSTPISWRRRFPPRRNRFSAAAVPQHGQGGGDDDAGSGRARSSRRASRAAGRQSPVVGPQRTSEGAGDDRQHGDFWRHCRRRGRLRQHRFSKMWRGWRILGTSQPRRKRHLLRGSRAAEQPSGVSGLGQSP